MKKLFGLMMGVFGLAVAGAVFASQISPIETQAYDASSLSGTIDLNDTPEASIRSYYSSLNALSDSERQGTNLLKNLKNILKNGQKYYSYDTGKTNIWKMYEIIDRDWAKSPASSTEYGTYNAVTNKITGYTYGSSSSNSKNNPYIHALYVNRDVNNQTTAWDDHNQDQWGINQEHIWAKSNGFDEEASGGARGDPMHLWAGNGYVNGKIHSNYSYAFVDKSRNYEDAGSKYANLSGNLRGLSSTFPSSSYNVFEPQDCDKGDIARSLFYMAARYNYVSGSDSDGINANNPNLQLIQDVAYVAKGYTSSTSKLGTLGVLSDLLEWNRIDPPDEWEIHRNNLLYTNYTNNRNPFIDFPEWAEYIWGSATYNGRAFDSYDSTPTGVASPATNTLNAFGSTSVSITLQDRLRLMQDGTFDLTATSSPAATINWSTSNDSIASISSASGSSTRVTGKSEGVATITASVTVDAKVYSRTCEVIVSSTPEVILNKGADTLLVDGRDELIAYATNGADITWTTSNASVATISSASSSSDEAITITAKAAGSATITARATIGVSSYEATCDITVHSDDVASNVDVLTPGLLNLKGNSYVSWSGISDETGALYAGHSYGVSTKIQLRTNDGRSGIVSTSSQGLVSNITIEWRDIVNENNNEKILRVYGKNTPYDSSSDLYSSDSETLGTLLGNIVHDDNSTSLTINDDYAFIGLRPATGSIYLTRIAITYKDFVTEISASAGDKVFHPGETITASDITVTDNNGKIVKEFEFENHKVTYEDALGTETSTILLPVSYEDLECEVAVNVAREKYEAPVVDSLNRASTDVSGTTYKDWSGVAAKSLAVYAGRSAGGNDSIQINTKNSDSGIIATASGGRASIVKVVWHDETKAGRTLQVYGKNIAYSAATDLFDGEKQGTLLGTIVKGTSTKLIISGDYAYIGLRSSADAMYLSSVNIYWDDENTASDFANYLMEEDTANQCLTKFDESQTMFEDLPSAQRSLLMTSDDYVIATARERFEAWARHQGKSINYSAGDYVIESSSLLFDVGPIRSGIDWMPIILIASGGLFGASIAFLIVRKRKER